MTVASDTFGRPLRSLRISVTDRCNLRCRYCMPEQEYTWIPRSDLLTFEEIVQLVDVFTPLGVRRLRLTGGEPLLRRDLPVLVRMLAARPGVEDLSLTTNGVLLAGCAAELRAAGLQRVTISLDTLRPERFRALAQRDALGKVLEGVRAATRAGFRSVKLNAVVIRGVNDDELIELLEYARGVGAELRLIEYMDVGGATGWSMEQVVARREILERLAARCGKPRALAENGPAPAERFALPDGATFGIIASTTAPFCHSCDRSRLTADGMWYTCLYARQGLELRRALRSGTPTDQIGAMIAAAWRQRSDRGAEERLALPDRGPFVPLHELRRDYHLEMHKRGG